MRLPKQRQNISAYIKAARETYNPDDFPPRFSFRFLVKYPDFGFESLNNDNKVALVNTLNKLSQFKWSQLRLAPRHGLGYEKIKKDALNFTLPCSIPADRSIIAFRFCGKAPMLGYRSAYGTFYIVAFDSKFIAYKH
jgi:hypothetical protein